MAFDICKPKAPFFENYDKISIISYFYFGIFAIFYSSSPELSAEGSDDGLEVLTLGLKN